MKVFCPCVSPLQLAVFWSHEGIYEAVIVSFPSALPSVAGLPQESTAGQRWAAPRTH